MECKQKLRGIQILLHRLFVSPNKEIRRILDSMAVSPTPQSVLGTFGLLFGLGKYSNREMLCFLDAFLRFVSVCEVDLGDVGVQMADLKFVPSEKDTDSAILKYFEAVNAVAGSIPQAACRSVLSRYMFVLSSSVVSKGMHPEVVQRLRVFLERRKDLLRLFVSRGMYKEIRCTEDSLVDFCGLLGDEEMVDVAQECVSLRGLAIDRTRSRYLFQMYYRVLPGWYVAGMHSSLVPYLYYCFDEVGIYRRVAEEVYNEMSCSEAVEAMEKDAEACGDDGCDMAMIGAGSHLQTRRRGVAEMSKDVRRFNETGDLEEMFGRYGEAMSFDLLRYSEETDLKKLGGFLCKLKNEGHLRTFTGTFDFLDMDILDGLRMYLLSFHLSPEGQIIHRVVEAYASKYYLDNAEKCTFMEVSKDKKTEEFVFNLSFSFLVLNTKFHNPNVKAKPTFKDYMKDFAAEEIPGSFGEEYLESMYLSVKRKPLEFPSRNRPGKDHYRVFKRICRQLQAAEGEGRAGVLVGQQLPRALKICRGCVVEAYRRLFASSSKRFLSLSPRAFHGMCSKLGVVLPFGEYLEAHKEDIPRFLEAFGLYFGMKGRVELYAMLLDVLARIDKQRSSGMFSDLGISFLKSPGGKDRVQQQYREAYKELVDAEVLDVGLVCDGLRMFLSRGDAGGGLDGGEDGARQRRLGAAEFVRGAVVDILCRNVERVKDLSMLDGKGVAAVLRRCAEVDDRAKFCEMSRFATDEGLLGVFWQILEERPGFVSGEVLDVFRGIGVYNEDGFRCVLLLQSSGVDMFDFVVTVRCESIVCRAINAHEEDQSRLEFSGKDTLRCYTVEERYEESLANASNVFHFYVSSDSVVNQSRARSIRKSGCPLSEALFSADEMDKRLIYMIKKADTMGSKDIMNYALWIMNLLSSSLPLLSKFFVRNFGLLLTLKDQSMTNNLIKIFYSRVCKVINGSELCCECGYGLLNDVEEFIGMLVKYDLASEKDFELYFEGKARMVESGRIVVAGGDVSLVKAGGDNGSGGVEEGDMDREDRDSTPDFQL